MKLKDIDSGNAIVRVFDNELNSLGHYDFTLMRGLLPDLDVIFECGTFEPCIILLNKNDKLTLEHLKRYY